MASSCISSCVSDGRPPVRATYLNLYKWPESDAEFLKWTVAGSNLPHPRVVDSISCRQLYLRSYTFSRKETKQEKTKKCVGRVRERVVRRRKRKFSRNIGSRKCFVLKRAKDMSCAALFSIFRRLLLCTTKVDVAGNTDL